MGELNYDAVNDPVALKSTPFDSTTGEDLSSTFTSAFLKGPLVAPLMRQNDYNPTGPDPAVRDHWNSYTDPRTQGSDIDTMAAERGEAPSRQDISPEDANAQVKASGLQGVTPFTTPTDYRTVQATLDAHRAQAQRDNLVAHAAGGIMAGGLRFMAGALGTLADPGNAVAMAVPIAPEALVAAKLASASGVMGRVLVRAAAGAADGGVGMAALEPFNAYNSMQDHFDYSAGEGLRNVLFGAALGAGGHVLLGGLFGRLPDETKIDAVQAAMGQTLAGKPVDVPAILADGEARAVEAAALPKRRPSPFDPAAHELLPQPKEDIAAPAPDATEPTLRADADTAAKDMAQRAVNPPADPEVLRANAANQATIEAAPKVEAEPDKQLTEAAALTAQVKAAYDAEVAAGRLPEYPSLENIGKGLDEDAKAHADYATCLAAKGIT